MKFCIALLSGTLIAAGCSSSEPAATPAKPMAPTMAKPAMAVMAGCPDKDASHVLTVDEPVFTSLPGEGVAPVAMLKSGSKVLCMVPGSTYSKCTIEGGKTVYVKTASLKPTTN